MRIFKRQARIYATQSQEGDHTGIVPPIYRAIPEYTEDIPEREMIRNWYEKQAENSVPERWRLEKIAVFVILLAVTVAAAYYARDAAAVIICTLLLTVYGVAADPMKLTRRKLSRNSRIITAAGLCPLFVIVAAPSVRTVAAAAAISGAAALIAYKGNGHWRAAEAYHMSRHVLKALQPDDTADKRDACAVAWQADGAREVVAAAAEMGAYTCHEIEWAVRKAAYTIGFSRASTISRQHERERLKALQDAEEAKAKAEALRLRLEVVTDYAANYDKYREELESADRAARDGAAAVSEMMKAKEECRKLQAKIERLEAANEELIKTADSPLLAADVAEMETERRLKEALEKGFSVAQTEAYAGVSHRRAQYYLAEHRKKKTDARTKGKGERQTA